MESNKRHSNLKSGPVTYCISLLLVVHPIWTNQFGVSITSDYAAGLLVNCGTPNVGSAAHWLYVFIVNTMAFLRGGGGKQHGSGCGNEYARDLKVKE